MLSTMNKLGLILVIVGVSTFREGGVLGAIGVFVLLIGDVLFLINTKDGWGV